MPNKAVLLDLENNMLTANILREIIEHYPTLYLFNCTGQFQYSLEDLTEFSGWVSSGQVVILEVPNASEKEYEYAVVVGQLLALLEPEIKIDVISAVPSCRLLLDLMRSADLDCSFIQVQSTLERQRNKYSIPSLQAIKNKPYLIMVKKYCDALGEMTGKPNTIEKLKNSIVNILQIVPEKAQHLVGMLINLKIVKRFDDQVAYRKKVLKQWTALDIESPVLVNLIETESVAQANIKIEKIDQFLEKLCADSDRVLQEVDQQDSVSLVHNVLFKNFEKIDPVQIEVIHKLNDLKTDKPKDIYALRDLLEQMFPKSDIRLLLKELIEKGYIYWNGHEVVYSHEMNLN